MIKKNSLKFQFVMLLAIEVILWSVFSELFWLLIEKIFDQKIADGTSGGLEIPDFLYVASSLLILIFSSLPLVFYLIKKINSPVRKITRGVKRIALGDYQKIELDKNHDGNNIDEFSEIADAINFMSAELSKMESLKAQIEKERILLFASLAHDLKTPITSILGYSKALNDGVVSDEEKKKEYLCVLEAKAVRLNELIDRLFEYVKIESPENVLHKTPSDVSEILRGVLAELYPELEEKGFSLEIDIAENPVIKNVDSLEIKRVFTNIIANAIKHNPERTTLFVQMKADGGTVIADSGDKIAENIASNLFKPFVSGDESRMRCGGSGLGLALAKKIMIKHGGNLSFSAPYQNYTKAFFITF